MIEFLQGELKIARETISEREQQIGSLRTELGYFKQTLAAVMTRPTIATLSEEQAQQLAHAVIHYLDVNIRMMFGNGKELVN